MNRKKIMIISIGLIMIAAVTSWSQLRKTESRLEICKAKYTDDCYDIMLPPKEYKEKTAKEWKEKTGKSMKNF